MISAKDCKPAGQDGKLYLTGTQALALLPLIQAQKDRLAGLDTGGFISGYRGSPLGSLDQALWKSKTRLAEAGIVFQPGVNEELGASMVWGSQQACLSPGFSKDGIFGLWYGKGPGLDRAMDAIKHANAAGTSKNGGVVAIVGDDHAARSSTMPHQSEHMLAAAMMPTLNPSSVQEYIDLGLHGFAMSRYCGCWVGMIAVADTVESGAVVDPSPSRACPLLPSPDDFCMPEDGVSIRWPDDKMQQEARLQNIKVYAALAYARKNNLNAIVASPASARLGIMAAGKSWTDTLQALSDLGLDEDGCAKAGIRLLKLGMSWPLEPEIVKTFALGLDEILVVEEKRPVLEYQLKEQLYNWDGALRPRVVGKFDERGEWASPRGSWLLPAQGELTPAMIALAIASRIEGFYSSEAMAARVSFLRAKSAELSRPRDALARAPHYCSGCPHSTSTKLPEGSRALGGIGCHYMATWISPQTQTFSQMGGEGVGWAAMAPFTSESHIFANLGDGTYFHSGSLAIRQAIATKANITYKVLYNDAVAMTGGQPVDGLLSPAKMLWQIHAEGPQAMAVVADDISRYDGIELPLGVQLFARSEMDAVQKKMRSIAGCTIILYDQTCAAEKRRRRKRGLHPDPAKRVFINAAACEGCGDCGSKSNCLSILPLETELGRKRQIDQNSCNKDYSCLDGFCPSLVTVRGGVPRPPAPQSQAGLAPIPHPKLPSLDQRPWSALIAGVGGTGVVTIGQTLGMAAHLAGLDVETLDQTGLAQKGGAVSSHIRIARQGFPLLAPRIADGQCDLMLAADLATAASAESIAKIMAGRTVIVANADVLPSSDFIRSPDEPLKAAPMSKLLAESCGGLFFDIAARRAAVALFGEEIAANFLMAGFAWQKGLIPIPLSAIERAIEANGASPAMNKAAFEAGRRAAFDPPWLSKACGSKARIAPKPEPTFDERRESERQGLLLWGGEASARPHANFLSRASEILPANMPLRAEILDQAMRSRFKLAAYKDEYEVARLFGASFAAEISEQFAGDVKIEFHLAAPLLSKDGKKRSFGPWMGKAMRILVPLRFLRGTVFDPFGFGAERKDEQLDASVFEEDFLAAAGAASPGQASLTLALARNGLDIKGYGHVKTASRAKALAARQALMGQIFDGSSLGAKKQ